MALTEQQKQKKAKQKKQKKSADKKRKIKHNGAGSGDAILFWIPAKGMPG
ncbi:MAG: hypothetical protein KAJ63_12475 [Methyloprofundus sp.]|nr:hypothetical protein [Methyloprofundus sp.]